MSDIRYKSVLFFGAPGTGKEFLKYSTQGLLVPDEFTVRLWQRHMQELVDSGSFDPSVHLLILDGIPRTVQQAGMMDSLIEVLKIVHLSCSDEEQMVERLIKRAKSSGRPDDAKEDVVRRRLEVYRDETKPVLDHYSGGLIAEVNAIGSPAQVLSNVLNVVAPIQAEHFANALN